MSPRLYHVAYAYDAQEGRSEGFGVVNIHSDDAPVTWTKIRAWQAAIASDHPEARNIVILTWHLLAIDPEPTVEGYTP